MRAAPTTTERRDLIEGFVRLMGTTEDVTGPINLDNPEEFTVRELAEKVLELTGSKSELRHEPLPSDDPTRRCPDISLASRTLDREPRTRLDEDLKYTID